MRIPQLDSSNFELPINFNEGTIEVGITEPYLTEPINKYIHKYEGEIRNTALEKIDINNLKFSFREGGFKITGNVRVQARKQLGENPFTKEPIHTPWANISANFVEELAVEIVEDRLNISSSQIIIDISDNWYKNIFDQFVLPYLENEIVKQINEQLANFNGMTIQELTIKYGKDKIKQKVGLQNVEDKQIATLFKLANAGLNRFEKIQRLKNNITKMRVNARVSDEYLWLSLVKQ